MAKQDFYFLKNKITMVPLNRWDAIALLFVFGLITILIIGAQQMLGPYQLGEPIPISLDATNLPSYALHTVLRMFIALIISTLFTFIFGTLAAKNRHAERIIIPAIDILQSVPVLGFLSITIVGFISLFPGSMLGPECAAIFAIFTAQAWNMTLSFYQSVRTVPNDLVEAAEMLHLSSWQRFWRLEVPFSMPGLLWNTMMSMSASWFFVVASEAVTIANHNITLPGVGSYIAVAIQQADGMAIFSAILTMLIVITCYDQILFRPLVKWAEKFKAEQEHADNTVNSWLVDIMQKTRLAYYFGKIGDYLTDKFINFSFTKRKSLSYRNVNKSLAKNLVRLWYTLIALILLAVSWYFFSYIMQAVTLAEVGHVLLLGLATAARVTAVIVIASLIWLPIGVYVGMKPRLARIVQPIAQFLAAFPANLLFPVIVMAVVYFHFNIEMGVLPLMLLGTQWYVLFNVIAGAMTIPKELRYAARNLGVTGWLKWKRFILPGIFPYYITGAITAVGGAWNTSIVAEVMSWGDTTLIASGVGSYIKMQTAQGDFPRILLGICIMSLYVVVINRVVWSPLYSIADKRCRYS